METLIAMRVIHPLDRNAMKDWIDGCPDRDKGKQVLDSLAEMKRGEAWVWSPEIGYGPERLKFPLFKTYDSFSPQSAQTTEKLQGWAEVDLTEIRAKLESVVVEAKTNDPKELRSQLLAVRAELDKLKNNPPQITTKTERVEVAVVKPETLTSIHGLADKLMETGEKLMNEARDLRRVASSISDSQRYVSCGNGLVFKSAPERVSVDPLQSIRCNRAAAITARKAETQERKNSERAGSLPPGEHAMLVALVQYPHGLERNQLSVLTGYKRSSRDAYLQRLKEKGYVAADGISKVRATDSGVLNLGPNYQPLPTGVSLQQYWLQRLPPGEQRVLEFLLRHYPNIVDRQAIDQTTGYQRASRDAYLQRLKARELVVVTRGGATASDNLFI